MKLIVARTDEGSSLSEHNARRAHSELQAVIRACKNITKNTGRGGDSWDLAIKAASQSLEILEQAKKTLEDKNTFLKSK
jgi:hypothetical protein